MFLNYVVRGVKKTETFTLLLLAFANSGYITKNNKVKECLYNKSFPNWNRNLNYA